MSTLLIEETAATPVPAREPEPTLQAVVAGIWARLAGGRAAGCPVCGEALETRLAPGRAGVMGSCRACGSELR